MVWLGEELIAADSIVAGLNPQERTERDDAIGFLRSFLADGPVPYREVETAATEDGITRATLHRCLEVDWRRYHEGPEHPWAAVDMGTSRPRGVSSHGGFDSVSDGVRRNQHPNKMHPMTPYRELRLRESVCGTKPTLTMRDRPSETATRTIDVLDAFAQHGAQLLIDPDRDALTLRDSHCILCPTT